MQKSWQFYLGIALLIYNVVGYGLAALVPFLGFSGAVAASIAGGIILSAEMAFIASIALLGKPFFEALKTKFKAWFVRKPAAPPAPISKRRHVTGITMLVVSFLPYFIAEFMLILGYTGISHIRFIIGMLLSSDGLFVVSLFVLGGEFWERLKKLFEWPGAAATK